MLRGVLRRLPLLWLWLGPPAAALVARGLYSSPKRRSGSLAVGADHTLYWQLHGSEDESAPTAVFLHGGPGAGCFERHAGFFDPRRWRVVLFDQRGCGRSEFSTDRLSENTTDALVDDVMARADKDGSGMIDIDEFTRLHDITVAKGRYEMKEKLGYKRQRNWAWVALGVVIGILLVMVGCNAGLIAGIGFALKDADKQVRHWHYSPPPLRVSSPSSQP